MSEWEKFEIEFTIMQLRLLGFDVDSLIMKLIEDLDKVVNEAFNQITLAFREKKLAVLFGKQAAKEIWIGFKEWIDIMYSCALEIYERLRDDLGPAHVYQERIDKLQIHYSQFTTKHREIMNFIEGKLDIKFDELPSAFFEKYAKPMLSLLSQLAEISKCFEDALKCYSDLKNRLQK